MKRAYYVLVISLLLVSVPACSSTKPPAPAAVQGNRIIDALREISTSYEKKNITAFTRLTSENFAERASLLSSVETVFSKYESIRFTIHYTNMFIMVAERGMTEATFNWDGEWRTAGGSVQKDGGRVTFVFEPKNAKLESINGKNPFVPKKAETKQ